MKPKIRVWFADFFPRCEKFFRWILDQDFECEVTSEKPDFVFFSDFGDSHLQYRDAVRIYFTGENIRPSFDLCHFALTFDRIHDERHHRLPLYVIEYFSRWKEYGCVDSWEAWNRPKPPAREILSQKKKFCNFVVSNPHCEIRNRFFELLNQYKKVDSAGSFQNNMNGWSLPKEENIFFKAKLDFIRDYKFTIAFENSAYPGYLTEKIMDPMLVHSLPIYWGDPTVHLDFNPKSFINSAAFQTLEDLVQWVIRVDQYDELYLKYMEQPYFHNEHLNDAMRLESLRDFFKFRIFRSARQG